MRSVEPRDLLYTGHQRQTLWSQSYAIPQHMCLFDWLNGGCLPISLHKWLWKIHLLVLFIKCIFGQSQSRLLTVLQFSLYLCWLKPGRLLHDRNFPSGSTKHFAVCQLVSNFKKVKSEIKSLSLFRAQPSDMKL